MSPENINCPQLTTFEHVTVKVHKLNRLVCVYNIIHVLKCEFEDVNITAWFRAVLTGKHGTLVRRAPGWQGAPDDQQAKN